MVLISTKNENCLKTDDRLGNSTKQAKASCNQETLYREKSVTFLEKCSLTYSSSKGMAYSGTTFPHRRNVSRSSRILLFLFVTRTRYIFCKTREWLKLSPLHRQETSISQLNAATLRNKGQSWIQLKGSHTSNGWYTYRTFSVSTYVCCFPDPINLGKAASRPSILIRLISTNCRDTSAAKSSAGVQLRQYIRQHIEKTQPWRRIDTDINYRQKQAQFLFAETHPCHSW